MLEEMKVDCLREEEVALAEEVKDLSKAEVDLNGIESASRRGLAR